jgi:hypothetical protein
MKTRSSNNWKSKSGGWDSLNIELIDFYNDYPNLSSIELLTYFETVICNNYKNINDQSLVSTFVDDYILERFWNNPSKYIGVFNRAKYVMSPDYSLLIGMPKPMQMWNVYRNRLVGHVWQKAGINVIPTISWSDSSSFDYCFDGVSYGSVVAISNIGCRNDDNLRYFNNGYNMMIKKINPKQIVFQCSKKYRKEYSDDKTIFVDSFWDIKR